MTNRSFKAALRGTIVLAAAVAAQNAQAATSTAVARASIVPQVTVVNTAPLNFATIVTDADGGTVGVNAAGVRACTGLTCTGTTAAAAFTVTGAIGEVVTISTGASVTLTSAGGATMSATLAPSAPTLTLDGTDSFTVGGLLTVGAGQADGAYEGVFTATVNYQ